MQQFHRDLSRITTIELPRFLRLVRHRLFLIVLRIRLLWLLRLLRDRLVLLGLLRRLPRLVLPELVPTAGSLGRVEVVGRRGRILIHRFWG